MSTDTVNTDDLLARAQALVTEGERITAAHLRKVTLPGVTFGVITLDNGLDHTKPNTFGPGSLLALNDAIDAALADEEITALAVTGKQFILAAGADLTTLAAAGTAGVKTVGELGHFVFRKLGESAKPSFGFINGLALGGGLEVALHCTYRTVLDSAPALGLPEVMLGLVPGWGGAYLTPRLVGPEKAVTLYLENPLNNGRTVTGQQAFDLGLADAVFNGADYLEQSLLWAASVVRGETTVERPDHTADEAAWAAAVARARALVAGKTGNASPAARTAVDLLAAARTSDRDTAFAAEDAALSGLTATGETAASLYSFDLVQKRAKRPAGAPDKALARGVTKIGIIGAGLMASQFALLFVRKLGVPVVLTDLDQAHADKGVAYVHGEIDALLAKGKINADKANRLKALVTGTTDKATHFADADFVIEAVFEEMGVKKKVFAEAESIVSPTCVLATNTSSLSITEMAADLAHPERVVGFHFFNPVAVMPLLEIVRGTATDEATLATAFATGKKLGKTTIGVKDSPSFIVNRLLGRFLGEVARMVDEGTPLQVADGAFAGVAPMPPFTLLALVGPAIALHNAETLHTAFPERFYLSPALERVVAAGKKTYFAPDGTVDPEVEALLEKPAAPVELTAEQVRTQALEGLAQEARLMLDEGVVVGPEDLDLGMITGAGFSFWNGGLTMLLDREGISERVTGRRFH